MTSPILAAIEQLRASVEALPERERPWKADGTVVILADDWDAHVADCIGDATTARHIALTASPHVTEALVRLLDTWHRHDTDDGCDCEDLVQCIDDVEIAIHALAEAISHTRRDTPADPGRTGGTE